MQIELTRKFRKQVSKCPDKAIRKRVLEVIEQVSSVESLTEIKHIKKLSGFNNKYRIRLKDYRIGLVVDNNTVFFAAIDHRSDIYKYFP